MRGWDIGMGWLNPWVKVMGSTFSADYLGVRIKQVISRAQVLWISSDTKGTANSQTKLKLQASSSSALEDWNPGFLLYLLQFIMLSNPMVLSWDCVFWELHVFWFVLLLQVCFVLSRAQGSLLKGLRVPYVSAIISGTAMYDANVLSTVLLLRSENHTFFCFVLFLVGGELTKQVVKNSGQWWRSSFPLLLNIL